MLDQMLPTDSQQRLDRGDAVVVLDIRESDELALARLPGVVAFHGMAKPVKLPLIGPPRTAP